MVDLTNKEGKRQRELANGHAGNEEGMKKKILRDKKSMVGRFHEPINMVPEPTGELSDFGSVIARGGESKDPQNHDHNGCSNFS